MSLAGRQLEADATVDTYDQVSVDIRHEVLEPQLPHQRILKSNTEFAVFGRAPGLTNDFGVECSPKVPALGSPIGAQSSKSKLLFPTSSKLRPTTHTVQQ